MKEYACSIHSWKPDMLGAGNIRESQLRAEDGKFMGYLGEKSNTSIIAPRWW